MCAWEGWNPLAKKAATLTLPIKGKDGKKIKVSRTAAIAGGAGLVGLVILARRGGAGGGLFDDAALGGLDPLPELGPFEGDAVELDPIFDELDDLGEFNADVLSSNVEDFGDLAPLPAFDFGPLPGFSDVGALSFGELPTPEPLQGFASQAGAAARTGPPRTATKTGLGAPRGPRSRARPARAPRRPVAATSKAARPSVQPQQKQGFFANAFAAARARRPVGRQAARQASGGALSGIAAILARQKVLAAARARNKQAQQARAARTGFFGLFKPAGKTTTKVAAQQKRTAPSFASIGRTVLRPATRPAAPKVKKVKRVTPLSTTRQAGSLALRLK